jgi:adenosylcobinamide-GDP ribazoletransferase
MGFLLALEFLTILRLRRPAASTAEAYARAQRWYAVIGLIVGALTLAIARLAGIAAGNALAAATAAVLPLLLSRGLHVDGLADCADGIWGGFTPERRLEIMKDSKIGVFGALAIGCTLLVRWASASTLIASKAWYPLALAPMLGRAMLPLVVAAFPYVRPRGLGTCYRAAASKAVLINLIVAVIAAVLLSGIAGVVLAGIAALVAMLTGAYIRSRIGGLTGDGYGAAAELAEVASLAVAAALAHGSLLGKGLLA